MKKFSIIGMVLVAAAAVMTGCVKKQALMPDTAVITMVVGDAKVQTGTQVRACQTGDKVSKGDILSTAAKSYLVLQLGDNYIFRIEEMSFVEINNLAKAGANELQLKEGRVLAKVNKLKKEDSCTVKTPTAVAAVRGTEFSAEYNGVVTKVAVGTGKVNVTQIATNVVTPGEQGKTILVSDEVNTRDMNDVETLILKKISSTPVIEDVDNMKKEDLQNRGNEIRKNDENIDKEIDKLLKPGFTLDDIRKKYGRIDTVMLYSGKVYRGAIISRAGAIKMITPNGEVTLQTRTVKTTQSAK